MSVVFGNIEARYVIISRSKNIQSENFVQIHAFQT